MKTKPILVALAILVLLCGAFLFLRSRNLIKPEKQEVVNFLVLFNNQITSGNIDTALTYFEVRQKTQVLTRLLNVLGNKASFNGKKQTLFKLALDIDGSTIRIVNTELAEAIIPVRFTNDSIPSGSSSLTLRVHKISPGHYKIVMIDATKLMSDYIAYENLVKSKMLSDADIYSPITLKAFESAKELKTRYDSVIWFAHLDNKTYFYVVKGTWNQEIDPRESTRGKDSLIQPYKMGLVNPELKEIIPVQYDLIHNINGTFPGLIEVEKGGKKGFYDIAGNIAIPVKYDQVYPIEDETNLAVLKDGENYYYLKKDMSVSEKVDLKVGDFLSKIRKLSSPSNLYNDAISVLTEYNSRVVHDAIYIAPSYLVDLNICSIITEFKNPSRKVEFEDVNADYKIGAGEKITSADNWFEASFYSITTYFLGGRSEFYDSKNLVIVDKKKNRVFTHDIATEYGEGEVGDGEVRTCNASSIKAINDSLFEVKAGANLYSQLYDSTKTLTGGVYYHYLAIKNGKLVELPNNRNFGFTKYVKMDDSYLAGCYTIYVNGKTNDKGREETLEQITPEMLRYMKNEIYADYRYDFMDNRWKAIFMNFPVYNDGTEKKNNLSVEDSLTVIDKYNLNFINQKLKDKSGNTLAAK